MAVFDKAFVYFMDRLVWFILLVVTTNLFFTAVGISGVGAATIDIHAADASENQVIEDLFAGKSEIANLNVEAVLKKISPLNVDKIQNEAEVFSNVEVTSSTPAPPTTPTSVKPNRIILPSNVDNRNAFLDSIFNIPIATLRAVNELVQSIAGSLSSRTSNIAGKLNSSPTPKAGGQ